MENYFSNYHLPFVFEIVAAVVATITFIINPKSKDKSLLYFTIYLWFVVLVENIGLYPKYICNHKYDESGFFANNIDLIKNFWIYNIYTVIAYSFFSIYFFKQFADNKLLKKVKLFLCFFLIFSMSYMLWTGVFIRSYSKFIELLGLVIYLISVGYYYYKLLTSNKILSIGKSLPFFISISTLLFFLTMTPLFLSSEFISIREAVFTKYYRIIITYANYFLYGMFIFGIVKCYWFKKSQSKKSSLSSTLS
ncbi:MAG: hypothetical protein ACI9Y7_001294 [Dokdonia sp.]|jgi:hypothetical protein